jgi:hypothetical protein
MKPADPETRALLTFDWLYRESRARFLIIATILAISGGLASFAIFRVTPMVLKLPDARNQAIIILDPSSLAAQRLIDRASDQSFLLLADNNASETSQTKLTDAAPVFEPGFKNFRLQLRDLDQAQPPELRPRLFTPAHSLLPPKPVLQVKKQPPAVPPARVAKIVVEVSKELLARWQPPMLALPEANMNTNASLSYSIAVDHYGRVTSALPINEPDTALAAAANATSGADAEALQHYIRSLRFKPEPTASTPQWGILTISWQREAHP